MFYIEILKRKKIIFKDNFTYAFDSLSGTGLKVSLNKIISVYPGCDSLTMSRECMWLTE